jgi:hypothetical protein
MHATLSFQTGASNMRMSVQYPGTKAQKHGVVDVEFRKIVMWFRIQEKRSQLFEGKNL